MSENDKHKNVDDGDKDRSPQVGSLLRATRTRLGEDLRDIADVLCIRYLYLEAIEDCRYGELPGDTYVIGFIRSYAEHMGLDGEEVVRRFRAEQTGNRRSNELSFPTPVPESGMPKGAIVFIGVVLAVLVYGGWYMSTTDEGILSDLISPVPDHLKNLVTGDDAGTTTSPDAGGSDATGAEASTETPTETAPDVMVPQPALPPETPASTTTEVTPSAITEATPEVVADAQTVAEPAEQPKVKVEAQAQAVVEAAQSVAPSTETTNNAAAMSAESAVTETVTTTSEQANAAAMAAAEQMTQTANKIAASIAEPTPTPAKTVAAADVPATSVTERAAETPSVAETPETPETPALPANKELTADELNALSLKRVTSGGANVTSTETASTPPPVPVSTAASTPTNSNVALSGIVIRATSSSWVEVRDSADKIIFTGLMSAGATYNVPDIDGLSLATGNAGALDIMVDGTSVPMLGDIGAVRKGVALDADRLKAGTATAR